jgi:hypothetical protein
MLQNEDVRTALANTLVDDLYANVDVAGELATQLPPRTQKLAPLIAGALRTAAVRAAEAFLATPRAQQLWVNVNRRAHSQLVNVLEGKDVRSISTSGGQAVLDLRPLLERVATRFGLEDRVTQREAANPDAGQIVLLKSDQLATAQNAFQAVRWLSPLLGVLVLALLALAVYLSRGRRLAVLTGCGVSLITVGLLVVATRRLVGSWIVDSLVTTQAKRPAVHQIWLIETDLLRDIAIALLLYGCFAIVAAWVGGGSRRAVSLRARLAPTFRDHPVRVYSTAGLLLLVVIAFGPTDGSRRLGGIIVLALLLAGGLALWRREMLAELAAPTVSNPAVETKKPSLLGA